MTGLSRRVRRTNALDIAALQRLRLLAARVWPEEFYPGFRNWTASNFVSLLDPQVI